MNFVAIEQLREKGTPCREATNECDLLEVCTGRSGQCPQDIYKKNGNRCESNTGTCFNGICPTLNSQCRLIWGDGVFTFIPLFKPSFLDLFLSSLTMDNGLPSFIPTGFHYVGSYYANCHHLMPPYHYYSYCDGFSDYIV